MLQLRKHRFSHTNQKQSLPVHSNYFAKTIQLEPESTLEISLDFGRLQEECGDKYSIWLAGSSALSGSEKRRVEEKRLVCMEKWWIDDDGDDERISVIISRLCRLLPLHFLVREEPAQKIKNTHSNGNEDCHGDLLRFIRDHCVVEGDGKGWDGAIKCATEQSSSPLPSRSYDEKVESSMLWDSVELPGIKVKYRQNTHITLLCNNEVSRGEESFVCVPLLAGAAPENNSIHDGGANCKIFSSRDSTKKSQESVRTTTNVPSLSSSQRTARSSSLPTPSSSIIEDSQLSTFIQQINQPITLQPEKDLIRWEWIDDDQWANDCELIDRLYKSSLKSGNKNDNHHHCTSSDEKNDSESDKETIQNHSTIKTMQMISEVDTPDLSTIEL